MDGRNGGCIKLYKAERTARKSDIRSSLEEEGEVVDGQVIETILVT